MNIAEYCIRKSLITWIATMLLVILGGIYFTRLPRLEDPEFTIKDAMVITPYPGASAEEVEREVTNVIEKACQELGQLDYVESCSSRGLSSVKVTVKDRFGKESLPQVWDELRRKINDHQKRLPPGAGPSVVNDDYGDVYGYYIAITGEGYTDREIYEYAKKLQRELLLAQDVKRIVFYGVQPEAIYVEMRRDKMAALGISPQAIYDALGSKNIACEAGRLLVGTEYIAIHPTGEFKSEKDFGDLLVRGQTSGAGGLVFLRDVADIKRGYKDPPSTVLHYDGQSAIGLAISTSSGGNVVTMGESIKKITASLESSRPIGMDTHVISLQSDSVQAAINGFLVNLGEAVAIVVLVLLIFMGLRSGLIIGLVLIVTIMGSFVIMGIWNITLERISLGALVIALGMLVDNAIVVTDGIRIRMQKGEEALAAARSVVAQVGAPLLGATAIAIIAFAAIGISKDSTGEYCRSLFLVILISLGLSWVTAVTCTPLFCKTLLKKAPAGKASGGGSADPYSGKFYRAYRRFLLTCIGYRWITMGVVLAVFIASVIGFGQVKQNFFPDSTRAQFLLDFWLPEGTHIRETEAQVAKAEEFLLRKEGVEHATSFIGGAQVRFLLTYAPESAYASYAQMLIDVKDYRIINRLLSELYPELKALLPQADIKPRVFVLGPSQGGKIQLRLFGPDSEELRNLADQVKSVLYAEPNVQGVRDEWRDKVKVLRPILAEAQARRAGIDRPLLARTLQAAFEGIPTGVYRERDELIQIVARAPEEERRDLDNLPSIPIWSPTAGRMIPIGQVVTGFETVFEDPYIWRRDRNRMLKVHFDPVEGLGSELLAVVKPKIEKALGLDVERIVGHPVAPEDWTAKTIPVRWVDKLPIKDKPGYYLSWSGEAESSYRANQQIANKLPFFVGIMVFICLLLFNSVRKVLVIWLCVPLAIIGVSMGLLLFNQPFNFMAVLGTLSLSGMLIKNAIVLLDEIGVQMTEGASPLDAVMNSGVSRLIPVTMAACTTILGMLPLLQDAFFVSMAIAIMFGLGVATILSLVVIPVLYAIVFGIRVTDGRSA